VGDRAPALHDAPSFADWLTRATAARPPEVDLAAWCRSCAIRTLGAGCQRDVGTALLERLLDDAKARRLPWDEQWALLGEAALWWDVRSDHQLVQRLIQRYHDLGLAGFRQSGLRPYSTLRRAAMSVSLPSPHDLRVPNEEAVRWELIQLAHEDRWDEALDFCEQLRFFRQHELCALAPWVDATLTRYTTRRPSAYRVLRAKADWQETLIEELSKDTYNFLAELQALLDGGSVADAARSIASIDADLYQGVAPQPRDRRHLVSMATAIAMLLDTFPALRQEINAKYGEAAVLRVRQAIREGNVTAIRLATVQFAGTPAAAEAHRWLGDRALAIGWFAHAASQYGRAAASANIAEQHELAARQRLAAALLGQLTGTAASAPVGLGPAPLAPAQFEALVAELQKRPAAVNTSSAPAQTVDGTLPKPTGFSMPGRGRLDGAVGKNPEQEAIPNARGNQIDWAGRQIATVVAGDVLYTSNRFHVAAYDLNSGSRLWQSGVPPGEPLRSQDWGLIRMRPLVTASRVFARLLYGRGPMLACLDKTNGQLVWATEFPGNEYAVSDPVLVQGQLAALTLAQQDQGDSMLRLTVFDEGNGVVLRQHDLLRVNEVWWRRRCCEVTPLDDGLVAVMSGVTLCCDVSGDLRWVRRETMLPPTEEPRWVLQHYEPPLWVGDRLYVTQPGSYNVQCLEARSGRKIWSKLMPLAARVLGVCGARVVVQAENEVLGLASQTGEVAWRYATKAPVEGHLCDPTTLWIVARRPVEQSANQYQPQVTWLDAATGQPTAQAAIRDLQHESPHLWPLVLHRGRYWAFAGRGEQDPNRDFVELVPAGEPDKPPPAADGNVWIAG
jgi:outer membrane protein assembly factor BamB